MNVQKAIFYLSNIFSFIQNYYNYFVNIIFWLIIFIVVYLIIWFISLIVNILRLLPKLRFFNKLSSNSYYSSSYASSNNDFQNKISSPRGFFFTSLLILIFFILLLMSLFFIRKFNFTPLSKIISLPNFSTEKLHQLTALPNNYSDNNVFFRQKLVKDLEKLDLILNSKDYQPVSLESEQQTLLKEVNVLKFKIIDDSNVSETQITQDIDSLKQKIDELNFKYGKIIFRQKLVKDLEKLDLILNSKDYQPVSLESEQQTLLKEVNVLKFKIIDDSNVSETQITQDIDSLKQKIDELNFKYNNEIINKSINHNNFKKSLGIPVFVPVIRSIDC
ncbi:hypothetical protein OC686_00445 ['Opuntia sp.' phytoplasma]|uniref:hypothetical protein n=1 Tax=Candidatus Phytoplasma asiaticum TaxID=2763338 RepID=UPI0027123FAE|nr:hypothetical protein ['Opuntia sp.' phytoplasma]MDO8057750.1 hypothetical protein ['Opuntia sp.' phytoplasma]